MSGSLVVVGTGISLPHLTREAEGAIRAAENVFYSVGDPVTAAWIEEANPSSRTLDDLYEHGRERVATYAAMISTVLKAVRSGRHVCMALYGHPGVFAYPGHEAIRQARAEGFRAEMLPGVSAIDCLFADLHMDPAVSGCQMYEATHFLTTPVLIDPGVPLVLWQVALVGISTFHAQPTPDLRPLQSRLANLYGWTHSVIVYEASAYPGLNASVERVTVASLEQAQVSLGTTVLIPEIRNRHPPS